MLELMAASFVFLTLALGALGLSRAQLRSSPAERRLRALRSRAEKTKDASILRQLSGIPALRSFLSDNAWAQRTSLQLERANVHLRVGEFLLVRALVAVLLFVLSLFVVGPRLEALLLAVPLAILGVMLPAFWLNFMRHRRLRAIEGQLVETLTLISNAVRSGFGLLQGVQAAARQLSPPMSDELEHMIQDTNLGVSAEEALLDLGRRAGSYDLDMAITAIAIQRTTGGNLSEILDNVAETIRERERVQGEINTLTAEKRFSGNILSVYPAALAAIMFLIRPNLMSVLVTESAGWVLLGIAATLQVIGFIIIRRIVSIDI